MKHLFAFLIAGGIASPACAGFIGDYSDWQRLSDVAKIAYVSGAYDISIVMIDHPKTTGNRDGSFMNGYRHGLNICSDRMELRNSTLVKLVDRYYQTNPESRNISPAAVVAIQLQQVCKPSINEGLRVWNEAPLN